LRPKTALSSPMLSYALPLLGLAQIALAGMYPSDGAVKQVNAAEWKRAMNEEVSAPIFFIWPWYMSSNVSSHLGHCNHCICGALVWRKCFALSTEQRTHLPRFSIVKI
jgi:hypothetical protein